MNSVSILVSQKQYNEMDEVLQKQVYERSKMLKHNTTIFKDTEDGNYKDEKKRIQGPCAVIFYTLICLNGFYLVVSPLLMLYTGEKYFHCSNMFVPWLIVTGILHIIIYSLFILNCVKNNKSHVDKNDYTAIGGRRLILLILIVIWYILGIGKLVCLSMKKGNKIMEGDVCKTDLYKATFYFAIAPFILSVPLFIVICYFILKE